MTAPLQTQHDETQDLLNQVKAGFVLKNTTFNAWCIANGVNRANATVAILGGWRGPKAKKLVARVKRAAGVA